MEVLTSFSDGDSIRYKTLYIAARAEFHIFFVPNRLNKLIIFDDDIAFTGF